jgi:hypothetical protein
MKKVTNRRYLPELSAWTKGRELRTGHRYPMIRRREIRRQ